jgi:FMN-dependent NADH-azoreductase
MSKIENILRIDASGRKTGSISRKLATHTVDHLAAKRAVKVSQRDLTESLPFVDEGWIGANFTPADQRSESQISKLAFSDSLVAEIKEADTLIIAMPVYNFGIPAALKAWIDLIARAGLSFKYTDTGPVGLMEGKRAIILMASGGTPMGSEIDYATPYLRHALKFIGITDVTFIAADGLGAGAEEKIEEALKAIESLD